MGRPECTIVGLLVLAYLLDPLVGAPSCSCVPEALCPAPDVDLRLVDGAEACPPGSICCDTPVDEDSYNSAGVTTASVGLSCDGECVPVDDVSASDEYDEDGTGLIDVRLVADRSCPTGYTCRSVPTVAVPFCAGTCVPKHLCTMFKMRKQSAGCSGGNVCCSMDRTSWMGLINDINGMDSDRSREDRCKWHEEPDGSRIPPWLVSVWGRVELIPGITSDQFLCAGVLVDTRLVLTLASCVDATTSDDLFVNIGDYDLSNRASLRMVNIYSISEKLIHEDYDSTDLLNRNVALLRLAGEVDNGKCTPIVASSRECHHDHTKCSIVGWNRQLLLSRKTARPRQYRTSVDSFNEDLFCAPGTICLHREGTECDGSALNGSPVICEGSKALAKGWVLKGLLVSNCTGVTAEDLAPWLKHKQTPGFVQVSKPTVPSRKYLPVL